MLSCKEACPWTLIPNSSRQRAVSRGPSQHDERVLHMLLDDCMRCIITLGPAAP